MAAAVLLVISLSNELIESQPAVVATLPLLAGGMWDDEHHQMGKRTF